MTTVKHHSISTCNVLLCGERDRREIPLQTAIRICRKRKGFEVMLMPTVPVMLKDATPVQVIVSPLGLPTDYFYADFQYLKHKLGEFGAGIYPQSSYAGELIFVFHYTSIFRGQIAITLARLTWGVTPAQAAAEYSETARASFANQRSNTRNGTCGLASSKWDWSARASRD